MVILGVWEQMVISRKQEHLHSYNSQKCINDHQQREDLGDREIKTNKYHFVLHEAVLPVSLKLFKMPTNCQSRDKDKLKTRKQKKKKFKSFFLSYKARCAHQGGRDKVCPFNKALPPPFSWISMPWKKLSFYEYSTSKLKLIQVSAWIFKKHKIFQCFDTSLDEHTGRVSACPSQDSAWPIRNEFVWEWTVDWNATHLILS